MKKGKVSGKKASSGWVSIANAKDVPSDTGLSVRHGKLRLAVFKVGTTITVIEDRCPHLGAPLADGPVRKGILTCTWHGWDFDLRKGCSAVDPDCALQTFPTRVEKGRIMINLGGKP